jgi:MFS family permease
MRTTTRSTKPMHDRMKLAALAGCVAFSTSIAFAPAAQADEVSPDGKGIVGGALLGGEIVTITESIAGVHPAWAYLLGGGLGAVGGGVGGYFIEQASFSSDGRVPMYLLAGGLALVIPSIVLTLNATRYMPNEKATEDKPPVDAPLANPGAPGGSIVTPPAAPPPTLPPPAGGGGTPAPSTAPAPPSSLLDVQGGSFRLSLPVPEVRPMYSIHEQKQYGLPQRAEVRMPVFAVTF